MVISKKATTEEKLDLIAQLLKEVESEFNQRAELLKGSNWTSPVYRMLTEDGSHHIKEMHKNLIGYIGTFKARLLYADNLISIKNTTDNL